MLDCLPGMFRESPRRFYQQPATEILKSCRPVSEEDGQYRVAPRTRLSQETFCSRARVRMLEEGLNREFLKVTELPHKFVTQVADSWSQYKPARDRLLRSAFSHPMPDEYQAARERREMTGQTRLPSAVTMTVSAGYVQ
jgi:hypothetical protein